MSEAVLSRSVAQRMGIKEGALAHFMNAPASTLKAIELPEVEVSEDLEGDFDYIHFFTVTQSEMHDIFPRLKLHLKPSGMLWLSWPKARKLGSGLRSQVSGLRSAEGHRDRIQ